MTAPLTITMPCPPSANNIFCNVQGRGRVRTQRYRTWAQAAGNELLTQRRWKVPGPVMVDITVKRRNSREDVDNKIKAVLDLLVKSELIDDDKTVQEVRARWGDVEGAVVTIVPGGVAE